MVIGSGEVKKRKVWPKKTVLQCTKSRSQPLNAPMAVSYNVRLTPVAKFIEDSHE